MTRQSLFALTLALVAGAAAAQEPTPASSQEPVPIFGEAVDVRVVNLEVVVRDKQGLVVTGLGPQDFKVLVDGEEMPVKYFTEVRSGTAIERGPDEIALPADVGGLPDLEPGEPVGTNYLVFVDDFFSIRTDRDKVLNALRDDLGRLKPEDRMAIVSFDGQKLTMLSTWTNSAQELDRAIKKATGRPAGGLQRQAEKRSFGISGGFRARTTSISRNQRFANGLSFEEKAYADRLEGQVSNMISAAAAALRAFANPAGRKVMLLYSGGWPYEIDEYVAGETGRMVFDPGIKRGRDLYAPLVETANQVGYTIFTADVPGMSQENQRGADVRGDDLFDNESVRTDASFSDFIRENNLQYSLQTVARSTGGEALLNAQRLDVLESAVQATRSYYYLGLVPTWEGNDARHKVDVEVLRDGLAATSREGFVDFSRKSEVSAAVESVLLVGSGPDVSPLGMTVSPAEKVSRNVMKVKVSLTLPAERLGLLPQGEQRVADLELRVAATDEDGGRTEVPVIPVRVTGPLEIRPGAELTYETAIELRRVKNHVVVAIYDPVEARLWAATADVQP